MLLRPILTQLSTHDKPKDDEGKADTAPFTDPILAGTSLQCAKLCVDASIDLLRLLHSNFDPQTPGAWWWDVLYACTAGIVLIIARTCPALAPSINQAQMATSWDECQQILKHVASFNVSGRNSLKMLQTIHSKVLVKSTSESCSFHPILSTCSAYRSIQSRGHCMHNSYPNNDTGIPTSPDLHPQMVDAECDPLQSVAFDSTTNFDFSTGPEFQGFGDLDMMGSFFNWDTTSFDALGGVPIQN